MASIRADGIAPSAGPLSSRGDLRHLSGLTAVQNVSAEQKLLRGNQDETSPRSGRKAVVTSPTMERHGADGKDHSDAKTFAAEVDLVMAELRRMLSGVAEEGAMAVLAASNKAGASGGFDHERGADHELQARLLRYRYVRKIEVQMPPIEPLEAGDLPPSSQRRSEKIIENLQSARLLWLRDRKHRVLEAARIQAEKTEIARQRREEAEARLIEELQRRITEKESRVPGNTSPTSEARKRRERLEQDEKERTSGEKNQPKSSPSESPRNRAVPKGPERPQDSEEPATETSAGGRSEDDKVDHKVS